MRDPKTTGIAIGGGVILCILVGALVLKKIDATTFAAATASVGTFLGVLVGIFAGDSKKGDPQ